MTEADYIAASDLRTMRHIIAMLSEVLQPEAKEMLLLASNAATRLHGQTGPREEDVTPSSAKP